MNSERFHFICFEHKSDEHPNHSPYVKRILNDIFQKRKVFNPIFSWCTWSTSYMFGKYELKIRLFITTDENVDIAPYVPVNYKYTLIDTYSFAMFLKDADMNNTIFWILYEHDRFDYEKEVDKPFLETKQYNKHYMYQQNIFESIKDKTLLKHIINPLKDMSDLIKNN